MQKPKYHIFVCTSSRANGQQKGFCHAKEGVSIMAKFMEEIEERDYGWRSISIQYRLFRYLRERACGGRIPGQCLVWLGNS